MADDTESTGQMSPEDSWRFVQGLGASAGKEGMALSNLANQALKKLATEGGAITTYNSPIAEMTAGGKPAVDSIINGQTELQTNIPTQMNDPGIVKTMVKAPGGAIPSILDVEKGSIINKMDLPALAGPESQMKGPVNPIAQEQSTQAPGVIRQDLKDLLPTKTKTD